MKIQSCSLEFSSKGFCDIIDITERVSEVIRETDIRDGLVTVFVPGSTAAISTIEYETGAVRDLQGAIEKIVPQDESYAHNARWGDGNGFSHVRAALINPSLSIPLAGGQMLLGTWQQIILLDFDNRPRQRQVIVQVMG